MKTKRARNLNSEGHWGLRLQKIISDKKMGVREVARSCNVSPSVVSGWIKGNSPTDLMLIKSLSDSLEVSFSWFLTGSYEKETNIPTISELFEEQQYFDGYARIRIDRLIPKKEKRG